MIDGQNLFN